LIEPVITAWKDRHRSVSGHQGAYAILYQGVVDGHAVLVGRTTVDDR
jgi:hypothetical protein